MSEKERELVECPCCGKPTLELPMKIKDEELDRYTACLLSGEPYSKTYKLYRGKLGITVTALSDETREKMNLLMSKFTMLEEGETKDFANMFILRLFSFLPVVRIDKGEESISLQTTMLQFLEEALTHIGDKEWLDKSYKALLDAKITGGISKDIIDKVCVKHLQNLVLLRDSGFDLDFFEGIVQG